MYVEAVSPVSTHNQGRAPLLYEMLRSFTTLAEVLNLSRAVTLLGSTRQTVRRHISILEQERGEKLFELDMDRRYKLTPEGERALDEALEIVARGDAWLKNQTGKIGGLTHMKIEPEEGNRYYLQQHSLTKLWQDGPERLRATAKAWAEAEGKLNHRAFAAYRSHCIVFRPSGTQWVCAEIGARSSYATWFGKDWAASSIGLTFSSLVRGSGLGAVSFDPYREVLANGGVRFDHISTELPREESDQKYPISYARVMMGCRFPDNSVGVVSSSIRTYDIQIAGVPDSWIKSMDPSALMDEGN